MDVLENNVIGGFLFALGVRFGMRGGGTLHQPIGAELLQQTPLDRCPGDVLLANARTARLIEFKRGRNRSEKERSKHAALAEAIGNRVDLVRISRIVHWYVVTDFELRRSSRVLPYLNMFVPDDGLELPGFVERMCEDLIDGRMSAGDLALLAIYVKAAGTFAGEGGGGATTGGLLFVTGDDGSSRFVVIDDVRELALAPQEVMRKHEDLRRRMERELEIDASRRLGRTLARRHSPEP